MNLQGLLESFGGGLTNQIFTTTIGTVVEYNRSLNMISKLSIAPEEKLGIDEVIFLYNVPVITHQNKKFTMIFPYEAGDKVQVLFSHRDLSNILANDGSEPNVERFKKEYAVVIGAPLLFDDPVDPMIKNVDPNDFVFAKRDNSVRIIVKENNDVQIDTDGKLILGKEDTEERVPLGNELKHWLDNHTHENQGTGKPTQASPEPSKKVFVE